MEKLAPQESETDGNVEHLLNLRVPIIVKLAGKKMDLQGLARMSIGTIIEFDKHSEEELALLIRSKIIGFGKAIKIDEHFGLRVTSICDVQGKIQALGEAQKDEDTETK